jgi:fumarate hydratase subunit alpha
MRRIPYADVVKATESLLIKMNYELDNSFVSLIQKAKENESRDLAKSILDDILDNHDISKKGDYPMCQDTGMVVVFVRIGEACSVEGHLADAIQEGVRKAYQNHYLRKSVVLHPFDRINSKDNTPAIIHYELVKGDQLTLKIAAKGAGSENMSTLKMLTPTAGIEGVKRFVIESVLAAGGRACPPIILGIGIGGNLEKSALLAKEALFRDLDDTSEDPIIKQLELDLYREVNALNVGPMGVGGDTTCLAVKINTFPMHIASLPVAVNIQCHANRHLEVTL